MYDTIFHKLQLWADIYDMYYSFPCIKKTGWRNRFRDHRKQLVTCECDISKSLNGLQLDKTEKFQNRTKPDIETYFLKTKLRTLISSIWNSYITGFNRWKSIFTKLSNSTVFLSKIFIFVTILFLSLTERAAF